MEGCWAREAIGVDVRDRYAAGVFSNEHVGRADHVVFFGVPQAGDRCFGQRGLARAKFADQRDDQSWFELVGEEPSCPVSGHAPELRFAEHPSAGHAFHRREEIA